MRWEKIISLCYHLTYVFYFDREFDFASSYKTDYKIWYNIFGFSGIFWVKIIFKTALQNSLGNNESSLILVFWGSNEPQERQALGLFVGDENLKTGMLFLLLPVSGQELPQEG